MASPPPASTECGFCGTTQSHQELLKRCAVCRGVWYCSNECQRKDWKDHKETCGTTTSEPTPAFKPCSYTGYQKTPHPQAICYIQKPFTALANFTWLQNRPKEEVFKLLVDTYRMKIEDNYSYHGNVDDDGLYLTSDPKRALAHFGRFLANAIRLDADNERKRFPEWWSTGSFDECMHFAETDEFSNVGRAIEKLDIQHHYFQPTMPVQFRVFYEQLDGSNYSEIPAKSILEMWVDMENKDEKEAKNGAKIEKSDECVGEMREEMEKRDKSSAEVEMKKCGETPADVEMENRDESAAEVDMENRDQSAAEL